VVTYDEHGGYWDHVSPPPCPPPDDIENNEGFKFDRLGLRVPTVIISPWIDPRIISAPKKGCLGQYEHSSVPATLKKLFDLESFLTDRDEWAATFDHLVNGRDEPRTDCPEKLPVPDRVESPEEEQKKAKISSLQHEILAMAQGLHEYHGCPGDATLKKDELETEHDASLFVQEKVHLCYSNKRKLRQLLP